MYHEVIEQVLSDLRTAFPSILDVTLVQIHKKDPIHLAWGRIRGSMWDIPFTIPKEQMALSSWTIILGNPKESMKNGSIVWGEQISFPKRPRLTEHGELIAKARWWIAWIKYAKQHGWNPIDCDEYINVKSTLLIPDNLDDDQTIEWLKDKYDRQQ